MRKRNIRIGARLSEGEYEIVVQRIRKTKLSKEAYVRALLLGSVPREKPDERFYAAMRDLSGIANNANQLARSAATLGSPHAKRLQEEAEKWGRFQLDIRRAFLLPEKLE